MADPPTNIQLDSLTEAIECAYVVDHEAADWVVG